MKLIMCSIVLLAMQVAGAVAGDNTMIGSRVKINAPGWENYRNGGRIVGHDSSYVYLSPSATVRVNTAEIDTNIEFRFSGVGGVYDSCSGRWLGVTDIGDSISIPAAEIKRVRATFFTDPNPIERTLSGRALPRVISRFPRATDDVWRVPIDSIKLAYTWDKGSKNTGAVIGFLAGSLCGVMLFLATTSDDSSDDFEIVDLSPLEPIMAVGLGGALGFLFGRAMAPGPGWREISTDELKGAGKTPTVTPAVQVTLKF